MTTEQKFNCIFCKDVFDNKEDLQVHFRKHADPKFKSKSRFEVDSQVPSENVKEKAEMVSCDVCSQMFPTISKAITHKHKVHPDHDVKYFCPWCGKLFTMKHPYNIHIQTSHDNQELVEEKIFHCDCCDVDFFLPSAMIYHNKFFHRQDTDIPDIGSSKKLKLYNQEIIQLHYCAFCGEEYENRVNLYKHITDDHSDENHFPEEILRCPLCEAIFYHLDAYEIHLSFHSTEDLYTANNELFADLLDFSLETVPPMIEKVQTREELEAEAQSEDTDQDSVNAVRIERFLELAMDHADGDSNPGKVKKKKHKKSKKSAAITLDEFLSMNKDVFGEGLDFQGVEEVPTRVVAKQFKNKKSSNVVVSAELEKLKQKGIVVMKVGASKPTKMAQKSTVNKTTNRELKTSSEVLTKLINQSNNQIKIVKKSHVEDNKASDQDANESKTPSKEECKETTEKKNIDDSESTGTKPDDSNTENDKNLPSHKTEESSTTPVTDITITPGIERNTFDNNVKQLHNKNNTNQDVSKESNCATNDNDGQAPDCSPKARKNKDEEFAIVNDTLVNKVQADRGDTDPEIFDKHNLKDTGNVQGSDEHNDEIHDPNGKSSIQPNPSSLVNSLSTLKHLSHLTVKPVNQNRTISSEVVINKNSEKIKESTPQVNTVKDLPPSNVSMDDEKSSVKPKPIIDKDPTLDALKNLSKNITIKSLTSTKRNVDEGESDYDEETDAVNIPAADIKLKDGGGSKNITFKKIKIDKEEPAPDKKVINTPNNTVKNVTKKINKSNTPAPEIKFNKASVDIIQNSPVISSTSILKHLPNITTKPLIANNNVQSPDVNQTVKSVKTIEATHNDTEIIEISDIDDSDGETDTQLEPKQDATKTVDPLKNLKHITVKSLSQPVQPMKKNIKVEKTDAPNNDDHNQAFNSDDDIPAQMKSCNQKLSSRNMTFKSALKNLGKNITVKSRTCSPCSPIKFQDHNSQDSINAGVNEAEYDSDLDGDVGTVKITEIGNDNNNPSENEEDVDDCDREHSDNKPVVESPHDSGSDHDEIGETDFESEIEATTLQKIKQEITTDKNTICLNNLKNISKSITIKSLNSNYSEKQEKPKPTLTQESVGVMKAQTKQLAIKPPTQVVKESPQENISNSSNRNFKKTCKVVDHSTNESLNQKVSVNKEVTVKTFQTKTVIQEITTTVTKTIKTVNQTVNKQETRNSSQMNIPVLPQRVMGMRPGTSKNLQGVVIRHAAPVAVKPNNAVSQVRPVGTVVRPSKQIVPSGPGVNTTRPNTPRMPSVKTNLSKSSPKKQAVGRPLKFSPTVLKSTMTKRPKAEEVSGPFSCFKKPKESLIPVSDVPTFGGGGGDATIQVNATSHTSASNYTSTAKIVKGNSVVTATQMKSEVTSVQQLNRLNQSVGIKVKNSQVKQTQVQEKCESSGMKRTTLEAIEKLQKQGLLIKKPRIEVNENTEFDNIEDNVGYSSADEHE